MNDQKVWFKAKKYGWGWTPVTWQGWAVIAVYVIAILFEFFSFNIFTHSVPSIIINFLTSVFIFTVVLLVVCFATGEKPEWRWGDKKTK